MTTYEKWKERYEKHWCTIEQLQRLVELGVLSQAEYDSIVNPEPAPESEQ